MPRKNNIQRDLILGNDAEKKVVDLFGDTFPSEINTDVSTRSLYDIKSKISRRVHLTFTGMSSFTTEVKNDIYANSSGNIAIEIYNPKTGKNSGLTITEANLWCHIVGDMYFTTVQRLKKFSNEVKPYKMISSGGDDNATLQLYRCDHILDSIFIKVDKDNFADTILDLLVSLE